MAARYNPPPNWPPPPPGWTPPAGWQPDPAWGPAPPGHQFWVDDAEPGAPASPAYGIMPAQHHPPQSSPARSSRVYGWIIAGVAALAVIVATVIIVGLASGDDEADDPPGPAATDEATTSAPPTTDAPTTEAPTTDAPTDEVPTDVTEPEETAPEGGVLEVGQAGQVGDFRVVLAEFTPDANDEIAGANMFNDPPKGQYVMAKFRVEYLGNDEGNPGFDLTPVFVGSNARQIEAYDCEAVVPNSAYDAPTLERGGKATFQVCFDVAPKAIDGAELFVEDFASFDGEGRVYWSLD